ncbi:hypothetical protein [Citrobacter phage Tr1]|nr:hypothetical protein [Citrobacter phage Tr1]
MIEFLDKDIDSEMTILEGGAFMDSDEEGCYTVYIKPRPNSTEILFTKDELISMLMEIEDLE